MGLVVYRLWKVLTRREDEQPTQSQISTSILKYTTIMDGFRVVQVMDGLRLYRLWMGLVFFTGYGRSWG